ncbi:MAG: diguanylate cyclase [Pseudomonadota bacterium]|nr:diguanylate cyclase [Pseudomonadota bacterium]
MIIPTPKRALQHVPALCVLLACAALTILAYLSEQRHARENLALHAGADAAQFQRTLQDGVDTYVHLNRNVAAYLTAAGHPRAAEFDTYMTTADVLGTYPGLRYIGFVQRNARTTPVSPSAAADPMFSYPYLYAYPLDQRARQAMGMDFSAIPERWAAMQLARDSGQTTATSKHFYTNIPTTLPIILVFTPIYDATIAHPSVLQRRAALRGFVFAVFDIGEMVERVMGLEFHALFDLEIYDGAVADKNVLYDGDKRSHILMADSAMPVARHALVKVARRDWHLYFFPKPLYAARYQSWTGLSILLVGFALAGALSAATWHWTRRSLVRSSQRAAQMQFDTLFAHHPFAVYALDLKGRFLNANAAALHDFGCARDELIGRPFDHLVVPEQQQEARTRFHATLLGHSVSYQAAVSDGGGARVELSVIMLPVKTDSLVTSVLGIGQNITAQKLGEARLQESRKMLQLVIDHLPQRVFWKDMELNYLGCNEAFCRDAGLAHPLDIVGRSDLALAWRANAEQYRQDDAAILARGEARIHYEERQQRADGKVSWLSTSKIPLTDLAGNTVALLGLYEDITERKAMEYRLREMAHHDNLTGLANRTFFYEHVAQALTKARREGSQLALMYFDIDHFKAINDGYGHAVGDALLQGFAARVTTTVREMDVFARLGGDEFALLLQDLREPGAAEEVADKLVRAMQQPFEIGAHTLMVTTSIGVAFFQQGAQANDVMQRADQAMYAAKRAGRNRYALDGAQSNTDTWSTVSIEPI